VILIKPVYPNSAYKNLITLARNQLLFLDINEKALISFVTALFIYLLFSTQSVLYSPAYSLQRVNFGEALLFNLPLIFIATVVIDLLTYVIDFIMQRKK